LAEDEAETAFPVVALVTPAESPLFEPDDPVEVVVVVVLVGVLETAAAVVVD
jgi:hypothetical protein